MVYLVHHIRTWFNDICATYACWCMCILIFEQLVSSPFLCTFVFSPQGTSCCSWCCMLVRYSICSQMQSILVSWCTCRSDGGSTSDVHRIRRSISITPEIGDDIVRLFSVLNYLIDAYNSFVHSSTTLMLHSIFNIPLCF